MQNFCSFHCNKQILKKTFDGLDHKFNPEEYLQHIDAHITFTTDEQPLHHL